MGRRGSRVTLVTSAALVLALQYFVPYGRYLLYPLTLLTTWVHEMGHGLTAIALGGSFERLEIYSDASGAAATAVREGGPAALVALGGLLAPPFVSAVVLMAVRGPRRALLFLVGLAFTLAVSLLLWVRSLVGLIAVPGLALAIAAGARSFSGSRRLMLAQFVAVVLALDTVTRTLRYLFVERIDGGLLAGGRSDIGAVAANLGGPFWAWGALVAAIALALLALGLGSVVRGSESLDEPMAPSK
jgi:hypothetical protein